jgi:phosphoribosylglycinamide formyltransferase-1
MENIAVLFSGNGTNLEYILNNMHNRYINVVLALTNNPNANGIKFAKEHNIPLEIIDSKKFSSREDFDKEVVDAIKKSNAKLTVLAGFMRILTPIFTSQIKAINLHPSLLPKHKGLNAIKRSYEDSSNIGGVSVHYVTSELDSGEIIVQKSIKKDNLSYQEYYNKIKIIEKEALKEAILKHFKI